MKNIDRKKHTLDASSKTLGRLASEIAVLLRGKNKVNYQPHIDNGDVVEVINIKQLKVTGKKEDQKKYYNYSGYQGGLKTKVLSELRDKKPQEVLKKAVRNMLPDVKFRGDMLKRLIIK